MIKAYSLFTQDTPQVCDDFDDEADEKFSDDTANIKEVPKLIKLYVFFSRSSPHFAYLMLQFRFF